MSSKRKPSASDSSARKNKKIRKNGKRKDEDLSDYDEEYKSDASNDGSDRSLQDEDDLSDDLGPDDGLVSIFKSIMIHVCFCKIGYIGDSSWR